MVRCSKYDELCNFEFMYGDSDLISTIFDLDERERETCMSIKFGCL